MGMCDHFHLVHALLSAVPVTCSQKHPNLYKGIIKPKLTVTEAERKQEKDMAQKLDITKEEKQIKNGE